MAKKSQHRGSPSKGDASKSKEKGGGEPAAAAAAGSDPKDRKRVRAYGILTALGAANALWAAFLWAELLVARQGGTPFCAVGEGFDCTSLWDGPFASAIHAGTGMPVAGWGVVYGLAALVLPLLALIRQGEGRPAPAFLTGTRILALVGLLSLAVLVVASFLAGTVCLGCLGTYVLVGAYAAVALGMLKGDGFPDPPGGIGATAVATIVAFLALLYPGLSTPKNLEKEGTAAIEQMAQQGGQQAPQQAQQEQEQPTQPADLDEQTPEQRLRAFLSGAPPQLKQGLADSIYIYKNAPDVEKRPPRAVLGDKSAPLLITDFTDARCGHCAQLHATLKAIHDAVPPGSFALEPRHFPLDGNCNPNIQRKSEDGVSCVAAKAQICMEGDPKAFDFSGALFETGPSLNAQQVMQIAGRFADANKLKACMEDPATVKKLQADIDYAMAHDLEGTPLVLLNGKKATSFGPFLFAMILTGGDPDHPALQGLPPPNPKAHMH